MKVVLQPLNEKAADIIVNHVDLLRTPYIHPLLLQVNDSCLGVAELCAVSCGPAAHAICRPAAAAGGRRPNCRHWVRLPRLCPSSLRAPWAAVLPAGCVSQASAPRYLACSWWRT